MEFVRFGWDSGYGRFWGRWIQIRPQNLGDSFFSCSGSHICTKFEHDSRWVGHTVPGTFPSVLGDVSIAFPVKSYIGMRNVCESFGNVQILQNALPIVRTFFWVLFLEFVWFWWNCYYGCFWSRRIWVRLQNLSESVFSCSGPHFCTKFGHNWRSVGRTCTETSPSSFLLKCTSVQGTFAKILEISILSKMPVLL